MMRLRQAVISGIGVVSPFGVGCATCVAGLRAERSATRRPSLFDATGLPSQVTAEVPGFAPECYVPRGEAARTPRVVPMAVLAAREALAAAGVDPERLTDAERDRIDVVV